MISIVISIIAIVATLFFLSRNALNAIPILMVAHGFETVSYGYLGLPFNVPEIVLIMVVSLSVVSLVRHHCKVPVGTVALAFFLFLLAVVPLPVGMYLLGFVETSHYAFFQTPDVRVVFTTILRALMIGILLIPYAYAPRLRARLPRLAITGYLLGSTIQSGLALYQKLAFRTFLPSLRDGVDAEGFVVFVDRVSGFVGEPRHLAMLLVPSIVVLMFQRVFRGDDRGFLFSRFNLVLHLIVLGLTYSASGFFTLAIVTVFLLALFTAQGRIWRSAKSLLLGGAVAVVGFYVVDLEAINYRIFSRVKLESVLHSEFNTAASLELLQRRPTIALTGVGIGVPPYLIKEMNAYEAAYSTTRYDPKYFIRNPPGLLLAVLESGLLGVIMLTAAFATLVWQVMRRNAPEVSLLALLLLAHFVVGSVGAPPYTISFFGGMSVLLAALRVRQQARKTATLTPA